MKPLFTIEQFALPYINYTINPKLQICVNENQVESCCFTVNEHAPGRAAWDIQLWFAMCSRRIFIRRSSSSYEYLLVRTLNIPFPLSSFLSLPPFFPLNVNGHVPGRAA